ncbi:phosphohistidine phosphatase SixA [bacterium F16]|nr:phosphohistidine phosphatase SixA [bacterium F16]
MKLYLIRHAEAFFVDNGGRDELRPLTEKGRADAIRMAEVCNHLGISFDRIWSSPILRADETATLINDNLNQKPGVEFKDALSIPSDFNGLRAELRNAAVDADIALVGHMPFLGECLQYWIGGIAHPGIHVAKSSIICLDGQGFNSGEMMLKFLLNKNVMKRILAN